MPSTNKRAIRSWGKIVFHKAQGQVKASDMPKMEDVAKAKGKQEFVKVARTKNKKPRTWVIVYKLITGPEVEVKKSRRERKSRKS